MSWWLAVILGAVFVALMVLDIMVWRHFTERLPVPERRAPTPHTWVVTHPVVARCPVCQGSGAIDHGLGVAKASNIKPCHGCDGKGWVKP